MKATARSRRHATARWPGRCRAMRRAAIPGRCRPFGLRRPDRVAAGLARAAFDSAARARLPFGPCADLLIRLRARRRLRRHFR